MTSTFQKLSIRANKTLGFGTVPDPPIHSIQRLCQKRYSELLLRTHRPHAPGTRMTVVEQTPSNYSLFGGTFQGLGSLGPEHRDYGVVLHLLLLAERLSKRGALASIACSFYDIRGCQGATRATGAIGRAKGTNLSSRRRRLPPRTERQCLFFVTL